MRVRVGCSMVYESSHPTPMLLTVAPPQQDNHRLIETNRLLDPAVPLHDYIDGFGNHIWRLVAPIGTVQITYDALAEVLPMPDPTFITLPKTPVEYLPDEVLVFTLASRHCPVDLFIDDAWQLFGDIEDGWTQVQAICDWLHSNITYGAGSSTASTSGWEAYQARRGVCRDFAHLGIAFCRALNFPARYVSGYLPDINVPFDPTPMDFHAWFEVYIDGAWHTFDARHNRPRTGRVVIARGRDAVDVSLATTYGSAQLMSIKVWAEQVDEEARLEAMPLKNGHLA